MRKNRFISLILAITLILSMFSMVSVFAESELNVAASVYGASDIAGKTSFSGTLRTVAKVNAETNAKLIMAVYDGDVLQTASLFDIKLLPGDTVLDTPFTVTGLDGTATQKAKAYLWKDTETLVPLTNAMPVEGEIAARVEGLAQDYNTFTAVIDGYTPAADDVIAYQWQYRDNFDVANVYHNLEGETGKTYTSRMYRNGLARRHRVVITINDTEYISPAANTVLISQTPIGALRILKNDGLSVSEQILSYANKTTPAEYVFTADGMEFILLDANTTSDSAAFMLMTNKSVGKREYYILYGNGDGTTTCTSQYPFDMSAWLNNLAEVDYYGGSDGKIESKWANVDYSSNGYQGNASYTQIPESVLSRVDNDVYWYVEKGTWWSDFTDTYVAVKGGLQLLSLTELVKYGDKIGLAESGDWWLRTPGTHDDGASATNGHSVQIVKTDALGTTALKPAYATSGDITAELRPSFYVDKDFFLEVLIDLETAGAEVLKTLAAHYSREELLAAGYSEADLAAYFDPVASYSGSVATAAIKSLGTFEVNNTLKLDYTGTNLEDAKIQWYTSLTDLGCFVEVEGATGETYIPSDSEAGKYVKAKITLKNGTTRDSNVIKLADALTVNEAYTAEKPIGTNEKTPTQYVFTVADTAEDETLSNSTEFILLDTTENDESHFLVMTDDYIGKRVYSYMSKATTDANYVAANDNRTYIASPLDMAAWLNSANEVVMYENGKQVMMPDYSYDSQTYTVTQKTDGSGAGLTKTAFGAHNYGTDGQPLLPINYLSTETARLGFMNSTEKEYSKKLPQAIIDSINYNQVWNCEPVTYKDRGETRYAVKAGMMIPSVTELAKYSAKIGLREGFYSEASTASKVNSCVWTRTPNTNAAGTDNTGIKTLEWGELGVVGARAFNAGGYACQVRPIFYLDRDFFIDNVIDLSTAGSDVCSKIRATYSDEELLTAGYEQTDIDTYLGAEATE